MITEKQLDLIGKKLTGSLSKSEETTFQNLLEDTDFHSIFYSYEKIWNNSKEAYTSINSKNVLHRVLSKIHDKDLEELSPTKNVARRKNILFIRKIAASLLIILSVSFALVWTMNNSDSSYEDIKIVEQIKQNPKGQKSTVFLPDGSKVILNSESIIRYPSAFIGDKRAVTLIGEAFFDVEHNAKKPFIVNTSHVQVRVLGTSFNVKAFEDQSRHRIALASGQVEVSPSRIENGSNDKIIIFPGQAISYNLSSSVFDPVDDFLPELEYGWKDGIIYFKNATFDDVLHKLSSWYGVEFDIKGIPQTEWSYSGEFNNYALSNVLYAISFTGKFNYTIEEKKVIINF